MFIDLTFPLDPKNIVMPGPIDPPKVIKRSRIIEQPADSDEDSCRWGSYNNTSIIEFFAHSGTHIDAPFHVDPEGIKLHEFDLSDLIYDHPLLLEIPKNDMEKVAVEELTPYEKELAKADILMISYGYTKYRGIDNERYIKKQPSLSVDAANYLVDNFNIRAYGVDTIGIENIPEGKDASPVQFPVHKTLLLKNRGKNIVLEDLNLVPLLGKKASRIFIIPIRIHDVEAMPVTAFAEVEG